MKKLKVRSRGQRGAKARVMVVVVVGYTLQFLVMRLFESGIEGLRLENIGIGWRDLVTLLEVRGNSIFEFEIRSLEIVCMQDEEVLSPEVLKSYLSFERMVLEDNSVTVPKADNDHAVGTDTARGKDTTADAGGEIVDETTTSSSPAIMLIQGRYKWQGRPEVLKGLDTMIEKRKKAKRQEEERMITASQMALLGLTLAENED